jgi:nucleotide-binding universal stress UspA family protein
MKILVPLDGSANADAALAVALDLVRKQGGELSLISVVPAIEEFELEFSASSRESIRREFEGRAAKIVEKALATAAAAGVKAAGNSQTSAPSIADGIVSFAENQGIELIVMGTRGLSPSSRFRMGSVAAKVLRHAPCSVYVVKLKS